MAKRKQLPACVGYVYDGTNLVFAYTNRDYRLVDKDQQPLDINPMFGQWATSNRVSSCLRKLGLSVEDLSNVFLVPEIVNLIAAYKGWRSTRDHTLHMLTAGMDAAGKKLRGYGLTGDEIDAFEKEADLITSRLQDAYDAAQAAAA